MEKKDKKQTNIAIVGDAKEIEARKNREYTLDEAVEEAKIGKYQTMLIILTGLSITTAAMENINISYVIPYAKCDLSLTITQRGMLSSVSFLGIVSTSYFWGFVADTWGRQRVIAISSLIGFFLSVASTLATNFYTFFLFRFLTSAAIAGTQAAAFSFVTEFHTSKSSPRAIAYSLILLNASGPYLPALSMYIMPMDWNFELLFIDFKPWRLFLFSNSIFILFIGVVFSMLPESPKFLLAMDEKEKALQVLRRVYAFNTGLPQESYPVKYIQREMIGNNLSSTKGFTDIVRLLWSQTKPLFLPPLFTHTWKLCYMIFVIYTVGYGTYVWFPDFLMQLYSYNGPTKTFCEIIQPVSDVNELDEKCNNMNHKETGSYHILMGIGFYFFILGTLSSVLIKKIPPKVIVVVLIATSATVSFTLNMSTNYNLTVVSFFLFYGCVISLNIVLAVGVSLFPTKYRSMATSFTLIFGRLGGFTGGTIVGVFLEYSCTAIFYVSGTLLVGCILIFLSIKTDESSQDTTETTETTKSKSTAVEFYRPITEKSILEQVLSK